MGRRKITCITALCKNVYAACSRDRVAEENRLPNTAIGLDNAYSRGLASQYRGRARESEGGSASLRIKAPAKTR